MRNRLKWMCMGIGVMYGMQLLILFIIHNFIPLVAPPAFSNLLATVVYTIVAFMAGGFVIGLMADRIEILEPVVATMATLAIDVVTTKAGGLSGIFLFSLAVGDKDYGTAFVIAAVGAVAALAGALAGERLAIPEETWIDQAAVVLGLVGLVTGPYLMISSIMAIPVKFTLFLGFLLLGGILWVSRRFQAQDREEESMSIRPHARGSH